MIGWFSLHLIDQHKLSFREEPVTEVSVMLKMMVA